MSVLTPASAAPWGVLGICWICTCTTAVWPLSAVIQLLFNCCHWCQTLKVQPVPRAELSKVAATSVVAAAQMQLLVKGVPFLMYPGLISEHTDWTGIWELKEPRCCFHSLPHLLCMNRGMYEKCKIFPQGGFIPVTYSNKQGANEKWRKRKETTAVLLPMFSYPT